MGVGGSNVARLCAKGAECCAQGRVQDSVGSLEGRPRRPVREPADRLRCGSLRQWDPQLWGPLLVWLELWLQYCPA